MPQPPGITSASGRLRVFRLPTLNWKRSKIRSSAARSRRLAARGRIFISQFLQVVANHASERRVSFHCDFADPLDQLIVQGQGDIHFPILSELFRGAARVRPKTKRRSLRPCSHQSTPHSRTRGRAPRRPPAAGHTCQRHRCKHLPSRMIESPLHARHSPYPSEEIPHGAHHH